VAQDLPLVGSVNVARCLVLHAVTAATLAHSSVSFEVAVVVHVVEAQEHFVVLAAARAPPTVHVEHALLKALLELTLPTRRTRIAQPGSGHFV
jgi:hypothetical protein